MPYRKPIDHVVPVLMHRDKVLLVKRLHSGGTTPEYELAKGIFNHENHAHPQRTPPGVFGKRALEALREKTGVDGVLAVQAPISVQRILQGAKLREHVARHRAYLAYPKLPTEPAGSKEGEPPRITLTPDHDGHAWVSRAELAGFKLRPNDLQAVLLAFKKDEQLRQQAGRKSGITRESA